MEINMKRLEGKVAVVTGGNSGIGLASAKRLHEEGARVAIAGRSKKTLQEAVNTIGNGVLAVQADVAKLADVDKLYAEVSKKLGKIDVLFVNAGVAKFAPLAETSESLYDEQFDINIKGAYFTIQKALPFLNDGASIILNTSVADRKGTAGTSAYSATKAALRSLARTAAAELVGRGIRVNTVAAWPAGGSGRRSGVPGFRRRVVHHRRGNQCGRRNGADLNASSWKEAAAVLPLFIFSKPVIWHLRRDPVTWPCSRRGTTCAWCHAVRSSCRRVRSSQGNAR